MLTGFRCGTGLVHAPIAGGYWKEYRAEHIDIEEIRPVDDELVPGVGVSFHLTTYPS